MLKTIWLTNRFVGWVSFFQYLYRLSQRLILCSFPIFDWHVCKLRNNILFHKAIMFIIESRTLHRQNELILSIKLIFGSFLKLAILRNSVFLFVLYFVSWFLQIIHRLWWMYWKNYKLESFVRSLTLIVNDLFSKKLRRAMIKWRDEFQFLGYLASLLYLTLDCLPPVKFIQIIHPNRPKVMEKIVRFYFSSLKYTNSVKLCHCIALKGQNGTSPSGKKNLEVRFLFIELIDWITTLCITDRYNVRIKQI